MVKIPSSFYDCHFLLCSWIYESMKALSLSPLNILSSFRIAQTLLDDKGMCYEENKEKM